MNMITLINKGIVYNQFSFLKTAIENDSEKLVSYDYTRVQVVSVITLSSDEPVRDEEESSVFLPV